MKIHVGFNEELLHQDADRGSSLIFYITWEHDGVYYPGRKWDDFGEIILGWWLYSAYRFLQGHKFGNFGFMDGSFELFGTYNHEAGIVELVPEKGDFTWNVPLSELLDELVKAAQTVLIELKRNGIKEREALSKTLALLQSALAK